MVLVCVRNVGPLFGKILRKYLPELALASSLVALALQLTWPKIGDWLAQPRPGVLGVMSIEEVPYRRCLANNCLVYLPPGYCTHCSYPLLLYLHGSGSRGSDIERVRRLGLPRFLNEGGSYPTIVAAPQCQMNTSWHPEEVQMFLDFLIGRFAVDPNRVYILGESMGAYGAWNCATYMPERLAAVIPFCGGGDVDLADTLVQLPIWAFHGERDTVVPPTESKAMVDAINKAGGIARLTLLSGRGHDIGDVAWNNQKLLQWMLDQRRDVNENP